VFKFDRTQKNWLRPHPGAQQHLLHRASEGSSRDVRSAMPQSFAKRPARSNGLFLGPDSHGNWVVMDREGRCGGLFATEQAARAYALLENGSREDGVEFVIGLELTFGQPGNDAASDTSSYRSFTRALERKP
jgi:hypothetical protein